MTLRAQETLGKGLAGTEKNFWSERRRSHDIVLQESAAWKNREVLNHTLFLITREGETSEILLKTKDQGKGTIP